MRLLKGSELTKEVQGECLSSFVNRFTGDYVPSWVRVHEATNPLQFSGDLDWLANTEFHVKQDGSLDLRYKHCFSNPTWPNNPELRRVSK